MAMVRPKKGHCICAVETVRVSEVLASLCRALDPTDAHGSLEHGKENHMELRKAQFDCEVPGDRPPVQVVDVEAVMDAILRICSEHYEREREVLAKLCHKYDDNGNGVLELAEWKNVLTALATSSGTVITDAEVTSMFIMAMDGSPEGSDGVTAECFSTVCQGRLQRIVRGAALDKMLLSGAGVTASVTVRLTRGESLMTRQVLPVFRQHVLISLGISHEDGVGGSRSGSGGREGRGKGWEKGVGSAAVGSQDDGVLSMLSSSSLMHNTLHSLYEEEDEEDEEEEDEEGKNAKTNTTESNDAAEGRRSDRAFVNLRARISTSIPDSELIHALDIHDGHAGKAYGKGEKEIRLPSCVCVCVRMYFDVIRLLACLCARGGCMCALYG